MKPLPPEAKRERRQGMLLAGLLMLAIAAVYWPVTVLVVWRGRRERWLGGGVVLVIHTIAWRDCHP